MEGKSIFDGAINQQYDNETWIAAVNVTSNSLMILKQRFFMVKETINVQSVKMTS